MGPSALISLWPYQQPSLMFTELHCPLVSKDSTPRSKVWYPEFQEEMFCTISTYQAITCRESSLVQKSEFPSMQEARHFQSKLPEFGNAQKMMEINSENGKGRLPFSLRRFHISEEYGFLLPNPLVGKQAAWARRLGRERRVGVICLLYFQSEPLMANCIYVLGFVERLDWEFCSLA